MNVVPLGDKVVVKRVEAEAVTAGGIVLPDAAQEKPQQGRVLSIGDGILLADGTRQPPEIKVADEDLLIMSVNSIIAVLD
jgi:chaperonin GroES